MADGAVELGGAYQGSRGERGDLGQLDEVTEK